MPKHKLNLNPAEELVPIDDSVPEVDVNIEEEAALPIDPIQPTKPVLGKAVPEEEKDEHEEYSKSVKKRINKLTGKLREAERREQTATVYAKNVYEENKRLSQQKQNIDGNYIIAEANRITAETEATKNILKKANEESNVDKQAEAQQKLASLAVEAQRVQALNQARNAQSGRVPQQYTEAAQPQPQYPEPDPKAESWAEDNPWFGNDRAMTMTSFVIHHRLQ